MSSLLRGLIKGHKVRFMAVNTTSVVNSAIKLTPASPLACIALGRLTSITSMLAMMNKEENATVSVQIHGDGPIGVMIADGNTRGELRSFIKNPLVHVPLKNGQYDVGGAIGKGRLTVVTDLGIGHPFHSEVELQSGEIGEDFSYYFTMSEQTPSAVVLGVLLKDNSTVDAAGGLLLQMLPDASEEDYQFIEQLKFDSFSSILKKVNNLEELLNAFGLESEYSELFPLKHRCHCNKKRFIDAIALLEEEEILSMIKEEHDTELTCNFCGKNYRLTEKDLRESLSKRAKSKKQS